MKSVWDRIFVSNNTQPLTPDEQEQALRELAQAVSRVSKLQATPEHERIKQRIEAKIANNQPPLVQ